MKLLFTLLWVSDCLGKIIYCGLYLAWKTGVSTVVESCLRETTKIMMKTKMGA